MELGIRGRKAIVAGGSAGMGRATAEALAAAGADIILSARGEERLRAVAADIANRTGASVTPVTADHSTIEGRTRLIAACPDTDILVITISPPPFIESFRDIGIDDWHTSIDSGLIGPVELIRELSEGMVARQWGRIVNIATVAAKFPVEMRMLSGASRAALINYTAVVSRKLAKHNVVLNNLLPGMFHTDAIEDWLIRIEQENSVDREGAIRLFCKRWRIPSGKIGQPEDIGKFAATLCSEFACYTVGQNIVVDGGMVPGMF